MKTTEKVRSKKYHMQNIKVSERDIKRNLKLILKGKELDLPLVVLNSRGFHERYMRLVTPARIKKEIKLDIERNCKRCKKLFKITDLRQLHCSLECRQLYNTKERYIRTKRAKKKNDN